MTKRLTWVPLLVVPFWLGGGGVGEASCTGSAIWIATAGSVAARGIRVAWGVEPACDVIETGLLLGTQPAALGPVGQPIYAYRAAYQQQIPVAETATYWIAAYARDEVGGLIQSPPRPVVIVVPPPVQRCPPRFPR